jgi:predicted phosphodiesterase
VPVARILICFVAICLSGKGQAHPESQFAILGDRTGEVQPGVYEQVWRETAAEKPSFVLTVGDTIQGLNNNTARSEWGSIRRLLLPYASIPIYLTAGNHDVWSQESEALFKKYSRHGIHYSFDVEQVHVTVLDNSRSDQLSADEMQFLENDLKTHANRRIKIIVSHRPSWLLPVILGDTNSRLHQLAKHYEVAYVIAGHIHQMLHFELDGVTYLSIPSAGGHLRASKRYEDGWFFAHTVAQVNGNKLRFKIEEVSSPFGSGRVTSAEDWGAAGLVNRNAPVTRQTAN